MDHDKMNEESLCTADDQATLPQYYKGSSTNTVLKYLEKTVLG